LYRYNFDTHAFIDDVSDGSEAEAKQESKQQALDLLTAPPLLYFTHAETKAAADKAKLLKAAAPVAQAQGTAPALPSSLQVHIVAPSNSLPRRAATPPPSGASPAAAAQVPGKAAPPPSGAFPVAAAQVPGKAAPPPSSKRTAQVPGKAAPPPSGAPPAAAKRAAPHNCPHHTSCCPGKCNECTCAACIANQVVAGTARRRVASKYDAA